ncbi:MAG TPA: hypothetical protein PLQ94_06250 [Anaerolineales bacterium]|nr:hypothetical protein [Anaerolineales bacterium]
MKTTYLFLFVGVLSLLLALLNKQLLRWIGFKPMSELFTNPNFQRSARITENLVRLFWLVFGISFLFQGLAAPFFSSDVFYKISYAILGLSGLIVLTIIGINIANWKAK